MDGTRGSDGGLERLLAAERELEGLLEERRHRAERIRQEAREYARRRTAGFEERLERELEEIRERVERETARTLAEVRARAERRIERYGETSPAALEPLVQLAVASVLGMSGPDQEPPG